MYINVWNKEGWFNIHHIFSNTQPTNVTHLLPTAIPPCPVHNITRYIAPVDIIGSRVPVHIQSVAHCRQGDDCVHVRGRVQGDAPDVELAREYKEVFDVCTIKGKYG